MWRIVTPTLALMSIMALALQTAAYPPAVGIIGKSKNCLSCHVNNGPWMDDGTIIIDVVDKETKTSLKQPDGSFLIQAKRGEKRTVLTVIGCPKGDQTDAPYRNAWLYVDPKVIGASSLSAFAPGWNVNLPMACRIVGDKWKALPKANLTVLPMSIRPTDAAQDAELTLQVMLTKGESVKGKAKKGLVGNYFERRVILEIIE